MRILKFLAPGLYAFALVMGSLTLGSGCGGGGGGGDNEATVPPGPEASAAEKQARSDAMKKAMQTKRGGR